MVRMDWLKQIGIEMRFLGVLVRLNLASAMEYRASFISQIVGMVINNSIMLLFWFFFFDRFGEVRGYDFQQVILLFGMVAFGFGIAMVLSGNIYQNLAYLIAQGRLDYYLVFPRHLLLHVIFSRMNISAIGDLTFGLVACLIVVPWRPATLLAILTAGLLAAAILTAYGVIAGSLSFFWGSAENASAQMFGSLITFALYPDTLFSGFSRTLLLSLLPAVLIGAIPAQLVRTLDVRLLLALLAAAAAGWLLAVALFSLGLRRYESGSAINVNL